MNPTFFENAGQFRAWLETNHDIETELWVGFFKRGSGRPSMTWPESVDEALCFGWIDAVRKSIDGERYAIRFTRRRPGGVWSNVNIARVAALTESGLMRAAGLAAFAARKEDRSGIYAYEQNAFPELSTEHEQRFRADAAAWEHFQSRPASYRRSALWGIVNAKREDTKERRLVELIDCSRRGETIPRLTRPGSRAAVD